MRTARIAMIGVGILGVAGLLFAAIQWVSRRAEQPPAPDAGAELPEDNPHYPRPRAASLDPRKVLFRECTTEVGIRFTMNTLPNEQREKFKINLYDHGCGLAVGDFDGDGREDIYFVNQLGPNALYRNKGDGTFEDATEKAGVALGDRVCVGATFVDYDNDGHQDLYVTSTRGGNVLFHNEGNGTFKNVTERAGVGYIGHSQTAVFFDSDGDGFLDLLLTNTSRWTTEEYNKAWHSYTGKGGFGGKEEDDKVILSEKESNVFYRNNGNGTFTDATEKAGLKGRGWAGDAVAFDYDGDGRADLFITSMFGRCQLYHNDGGVFRDVTLKVLGRTPFGGTGAHVLDFNNDGRLDLFVVDMHSDMWMGLEYNQKSLPLALKYEKHRFPHFFGPLTLDNPRLIVDEKVLADRVGFRSEDVVFGNALYRNDGDGKFSEISQQAGLETFWPWGIAEGDFDNDGYQDVFVPAGMGYPFYYWPNSLMMNNGDGTFRDAAEEAGIEPPARGIVLPDKIADRKAVRSSRCAATGDFDGDGRLDLVVNNFNDAPYFFQNRAGRKNYIAFRLRGTRGNRDAIGAVVRLHRGSRVMTRQVQAAGGYLSQSSKTLHFGLGEETEITKVEIRWPNGARQVLQGEDVRINKLHDIREPWNH